MKSKEGLKYLDTVGCGKVQHFQSFQLAVFHYSTIYLVTRSQTLTRKSLAMRDYVLLTPSAEVATAD